MLVGSQCSLGAGGASHKVMGVTFQCGLCGQSYALGSRYGTQELGTSQRGSPVAPGVWRSRVCPAWRGTEFHL